MKIVLTLLLVVLQNLFVCEALACPYARYGPGHTMCRYRAKACPPRMLGGGTTAADRSAILSTHNNLRRKVAIGRQHGQPTASNMEEMKWDPELATIAQRLADQCTFAHDNNRRSSRFSIVGQNLAMTVSPSSGGKADFTSAINHWYNEVTKPGFSSSRISPFQYSPGTGHYTQVVWATSNRVGCGFAYFKLKRLFRKLYVCNYGPGGNMVGRGSSVYKPGPAASACVRGKSTTYVGLCNS